MGDAPLTYKLCADRASSWWAKHQVKHESSPSNQGNPPLKRGYVAITVINRNQLVIWEPLAYHEATPDDPMSLRSHSKQPTRTRIGSRTLSLTPAFLTPSPSPNTLPYPKPNPDSTHISNPNANPFPSPNAIPTSNLALNLNPPTQSITLTLQPLRRAIAQHPKFAHIC